MAVGAWLVGLLGWLGAPVSAADAPPAEPGPEAVEFFEKEIRPLLVNRCFECHGPGDKFKGGLRLTSRSAIMAGGDSGPAAESGKPADSRIIEAVRYQNGLEMPPKGKLPPDDIARFVRWVEMGLPWPASAAVDDAPVRDDGFTISDAQRKHWAFQPVAMPALPAVSNAGWAAGPIDRFILAGLDARGLAPDGPASKAVLLRRAASI